MVESSFRRPLTKHTPQPCGTLYCSHSVLLKSLFNVRDVDMYSYGLHEFIYLYVDESVWCTRLVGIHLFKVAQTGGEVRPKS